jgi:N-acetylmuramoyl-L-alanine amidase
VSALAIAAAAYLLSDFRLPFLDRDDTLQTNADTLKYKTVIIDAGHGGEDGGASSTKGLIEKNVNLDISKLLCEMLRANGINVVMTREDDRLLYDRNSDYQGRKKKLDLAARVAVANSTPNAIFVSIHMNRFPVEKYSGLQVYYSENHENSILLAQTVQSVAEEALRNTNGRKVKPAGDSIYVMANLEIPAVLVECGFLSNLEETALLKTENYQKKLAVCLFASLIRYFSENA